VTSYPLLRWQCKSRRCRLSCLVKELCVAVSLSVCTTSFTLHPSPSSNLLVSVVRCCCYCVPPISSAQALLAERGIIRRCRGQRAFQSLKSQKSKVKSLNGMDFKINRSSDRQILRSSNRQTSCHSLAAHASGMALGAGGRGGAGRGGDVGRKPSEAPRRSGHVAWSALE